MRRRDISTALLASVTGSVLIEQRAEAQTCTAPCFALTQAEINANVMPVNLAYPPGAFRRYGMDPLGQVDSATAFSNACASNCFVFDDYPGGGTYMFNSTPAITNYPLHIQGQAINYRTTGGTKFVLAASAGENAAIIHYSGYAAGILIENLTLSINGNPGQVGFQADNDLRNSILRNLYITTDDQSALNTSIGILLYGGGSGGTMGVVIDACGTGNLQYGIYLTGNCTTVKIRDCELNGNTAASQSYGIFVNNAVNGASATGCLLEGWTCGINVRGPHWVQAFNHFEVNGVNFEWARTAPNTSIQAGSYGDMLITGGAPIYPTDPADQCIVI